MWFVIYLGGADLQREVSGETTITSVDAQGPRLSQDQVAVHLHRPAGKGSAVLHVGHGVHLHSGSVLKQFHAAGNSRSFVGNGWMRRRMVRMVSRCIPKSSPFLRVLCWMQFTICRCTPTDAARFNPIERNTVFPKPAKAWIVLTGYPVSYTIHATAACCWYFLTLKRVRKNVSSLMECTSSSSTSGSRAFTTSRSVSPSPFVSEGNDYTREAGHRPNKPRRGVVGARAAQWLFAASVCVFGVVRDPSYFSPVATTLIFVRPPNGQLEPDKWWFMGNFSGFVLPSQSP